jgi:tetratricopeptide (TPR) repeat protein
MTRRRRTAIVVAIGGVLLTVFALEPAIGKSGRQAYNQGTAKLREGDLLAAEALLRQAAADDREAIRQPALYNLAWVRYRQGETAIRKGPDPTVAARRGQAVVAVTDTLLRQGAEALSSLQQDALVAAYRRGQGLRKDLRSATAAVREALESSEAGLGYWGRAAGDFRGVVELAGSDTVAAYNAEVVERRLAQLVDRLEQVRPLSQQLENRRKALDHLLARLRAMLPKSMQGPDSGDEQEDDAARGPRPGQEEARSISGSETKVSPEDAARLLQSYQLDRGRSLPMGTRDTGGPNDRSPRSW